MNDAGAWLTAWFVDRGVPADDVRVSRNYFEAGWIDSFGVLELIAAIEEYARIAFTDRDFQDRRFVTLGGLAEIIAERRAERGLPSDAHA
jgi:acyl carrier protein